MAAGIAWDRGLGEPKSGHADDMAELLKIVGSKPNAETAVTAAAALLAGRKCIHRWVTEALLDRDLSAEDVAAIACGRACDAE